MKQTKHRLTLFCLLTFCWLAVFQIGAHAESAQEMPCQTVFFGESTTAHLSRRGGVLDTPSGRACVWRDESGTRMLSRRILSSTVELYTQDGKKTVSLASALEEVHPARIVLSFGLNGITGFIKDKDAFLGAYRTLIDGVRRHSPNTEILLQSVYPVRASEGFSVDVDTLNGQIETLNAWIRALAEQENVKYTDTASVLRGADGRLLSQYDLGDGIHLTNEAYRQILTYLQGYI